MAKIAPALQVLIATAGVIAGGTLAYVASSSAGQATSADGATSTTRAGTTQATSLAHQPAEAGNAAEIVEARVFPRRPRADGTRVSAPELGDRPGTIVGPGLPDRVIPDCPSLKRGRKKPMVYGIGSSTMGGLAKVLATELTKVGVRSRKWAKAGSGLARPDFHDWPATVPNIVRDHDPDVFVVVLGTNDNQAVRVGKEWFRPNHERWEPTYKARIDAMLKAMNKGRKRWIFWIGPNVLDRKSSRQIGKRINALMAQGVKRWAGTAWYVDLFTSGSDHKGRPKRLMPRPGGGFFKPRGHDGVHLTYSGLRWLLAEPVLKQLRPCLSGNVSQFLRQGPGPRREAERATHAARRDALLGERLL